MTTMETVKENFPHPHIPAQPGMPTYDIIASVHRKLKANAASVASTLGGGTHGLLGLTILPATYQTVTGYPFIPPINPGNLPTIAPTASQAHIGEAVRQHKERLKIWKEYNATDLALKNQLLTTFDEVYLKGLRNRHVGYQNVTARDMIQHLYTNYGVITPADLDDNDARMREPFDASKPIEELFEQIEEATDYADAAGAPYNNSQVLSRAYVLVHKTGEYNDACRDWRKKPTNEKTWETFKQDFTVAHRDMIANKSLQPNPYQQANAVMEQFQERTEAILEQVANSTVDTTTISTLTTQNETLQTQLANATSDLISMKQLVESLCKEVNNLKEGSQRRRRPNRNANDKSYCWTHGRTRNKLHTSKTCRTRAEGHQNEATLDNRMGGSAMYCQEL